MNTARVRDLRTEAMTEIKVGDWVCFKSDIEQGGIVVKIEWASYGRGTVLTLRNENGFGGEYLRYATETEERSEDCWVE